MSVRSDIEERPPLELSYRILPDGRAVVFLGGELDIVSAETAVGYVRDVIDGRRGPVVVDLRSLEYCDAHGLRALARMSVYAEQSGCPFRLSSPSLSIIRILRITGLEHRFPLFQAHAQPILE